MKKKFLIILVLVFGLFLTGCGEQNNLKEETTNQEENQDEVEKMSCVLQTTVSEGLSIESTYNVEHDGKYVSLVETVEKITSSNEEYLDAYKTQIEELYEPFKDVKYYDYDVNISGDTLTSTVRINYAKIDTEKMLEIDSSLEELIKNGRIAVQDIKKLYEQIGAVCH